MNIVASLDIPAHVILSAYRTIKKVSKQHRATPILRYCKLTPHQVYYFDGFTAISLKIYNLKSLGVFDYYIDLVSLGDKLLQLKVNPAVILRLAVYQEALGNVSVTIDSEYELTIEYLGSDMLGYMPLQPVIYNLGKTTLVLDIPTLKDNAKPVAGNLVYDFSMSDTTIRIIIPKELLSLLGSYQGVLRLNTCEVGSRKAVVLECNLGDFIWILE
jgi:hypothetical protein